MMRVLITGTSSGIGLAAARLFLDRGAEVVGLDLKECPALADRERYRHYVVDVCEEEKLPDAGSFDIVVTNAGVQTPSMRGTGRDIRVNLCGAINVTERYAFQPQIRSVLFNASASGITGDEFPEYAASKAGVIGYMRNCAKRLAAEFRATCNATCFGGVMHIEKRHGASGAQDQSMSNPDDFGRIAFALRNFDSIARLPDNPSYRTRDNAAAAQIEFRTRIDGTSVISTVVPDTSRRWMLVTSARIEKTKTGKHL